MTDSGTKSNQPAAPSQLETPTNNTLPEGFTPWEGSSMAVRQGRHWSSTLIWISAAIFGGAVIWAFSAKVDQTITVAGRLEPQGSVEEVDAPATGVVSRVFVKVARMSPRPWWRLKRGLASRRRAGNHHRCCGLKTLPATDPRVWWYLGCDATELPCRRHRIVLRDKLATAVEQTRQISSRLRQIDERIASKTKTCVDRTHCQ